MLELVASSKPRPSAVPPRSRCLPRCSTPASRPPLIVQEKGLAQVSDTGAIEKFCDEAIAANPGSVADYQGRQSRRAEFAQRPGDEIEQGQGQPRARRRDSGAEAEGLIGHRFFGGTSAASPRFNREPRQTRERGLPPRRRGAKFPTRLEPQIARMDADSNRSPNGATENSPRFQPWVCIPQNKFLLRIGWGEGGRRPDEVNCELRQIREFKIKPAPRYSQANLWQE